MRIAACPGPKVAFSLRPDTVCEMTLLTQMAAERARRREALRAETRARLLAALSNIKGIDEVIVFGSLTKPERFTDSSDVDVALESEPQGMTVFQLISLLSKSLGRRVDVVLLGGCRFAEKIRREGELWMLPA